MRFGFARVVRVLCIAVLPLSAVLALAVTANLARAFAGYYQLGDAVEDGNQVHVTMTLTLMNPRRTEVQGGIVAVMSSDPAPVLLASFSPIKSLPASGRVTISQTLTIPAAEYKGWHSGHPPQFQFLVPTRGTAVAAGIQAYEVLPAGNLP